MALTLISLFLSCVPSGVSDVPPGVSPTGTCILRCASRGHEEQCALASKNVSAESESDAFSRVFMADGM